MIVCHCNAVTSRQVDAAIQGGETEPEVVAQRCGAATDCGGCLPEIERRCALAEAQVGRLVASYALAS